MVDNCYIACLGCRASPRLETVPSAGNLIPCAFDPHSLCSVYSQAHSEEDHNPQVAGCGEVGFRALNAGRRAFRFSPVAISGQDGGL